jgi:hypothetical protein
MTRVDGDTPTVAGPLDPASVTVLPETDPTSPNVLSVPDAPGVGLAEGVVDEAAVAGLLLDDFEGGFDDPQPASDSAVNPATATAAHRDT